MAFTKQNEKQPYHGNHSGKIVHEWSGTAQRNIDPKVRAARRKAEYVPIPDEELPENLLVGRNPIREALRAGRSIDKLLVMKGDLSGSAREIVKMARYAGVVVQEVERTRLDEIYLNHQGLLAYVALGEYSSVDDIFELAAQKEEDPFIILLDGITDPHNLGAIIRSAECAGAHGVIIPERRSAGLSPACVKAAAGALEYVKVVKVQNISKTIDDLKKRGVWLYASDMGGEDLFKADLGGAIGIVIGAEGDGVSRLVLEKCDKTLSIPMYGKISSLNASVAAGIMLLQAANFRHGK